jgi:hypothetical protein
MSSDKQIKFKPTPVDTTLVRINFQPKISLKPKFKSLSPLEIVSDVQSAEEILNIHINNSINCSFKDAMKIPQIANCFKKRKNDKHFNLNSYSISARNHKIVFQNIEGFLYVFNVETRRKINLLNIGPVFHYYDDSMRSEPYFLIEYKQREIPTTFPNYSLRALQAWEKNWIEKNQVTQEYFDSHIQVINIGINFGDSKINDNFTASIYYYYSVDWAKTKLTDYYIPPEYEHPKLATKRTSITVIEPVESIISIKEVIDKVSTISDSISMNLNLVKLHVKRRNLTEDKKTKTRDEILQLMREPLKQRLTIDFYGYEDEEKKKYFYGKIYLDTGEMEVNKNMPIIIY